MAKNTNTTDQNSKNKNSAKQNAGKQNSMNRNGAGQNTSNRNSTGTDSEHNGYQDKVLQKAGDMPKKRVSRLLVLRKIRLTKTGSGR